MALSIHYLTTKPGLAHHPLTRGSEPEVARLIALNSGDAFGLLWHKTAKIFSAATGQLRDGPRLTRESLHLPILSPDGALLVEYEAYFGVRIYNFATRRLLRSYFPAEGGILSLAFAPGTRLLVSSNIHRSARVAANALDLSGLPEEAPKPEGGKDRVLEADPASRRLSTGSPDGIAFRAEAPELITYSRGELRRVSLSTGRCLEAARLGRWSSPRPADVARLGVKGGYAIVRRAHGLAFWRLGAPKGRSAILYRRTVFPRVLPSFHPAGRLLWAVGDTATLCPAESDDALRVWRCREPIGAAVFLPDGEHALIVSSREVLLCHPEYDRALAAWQAPAPLAAWSLAKTGLLALTDQDGALHLLVVEGYRAPHDIDDYWDGWAPQGR